MSTILEADDQFTTEYPRKGNGSLDPGRITWGFVLALFAFQTALGVFRFVFSGKASGMNTLGIAVNVSLDLVRVITLLLITAYFLKAFWSRLIPSLMGIRPITLQESVAIILISSILFGN